MKKSTTMRSLLLCGLSMLLCLSMLAGTTFAWFTDSVESGANQIVAGNLDVELYNGLDTNAAKITESTKLFNMTLWEPGAMVYENLTVANEGNLALKYQLGVNVANATTNANGDTLAKVLKVAVVENGIADGTTREALQQLDNYTSLASFIESGKLEEAETKTYGIVIWWEPSDIDNEFNMNNENKGKTMSIEIGVKLFATQAVADDEKDSFGTDYDKDAWMDAMQVLTADDLQAAVENAQPGDKIVVMDDITFNGDFVIPAANATTYSMRSVAGVAINLNGHTITAENVTTEGIATLVNGTLVLSADGCVYACDETAISLENIEIVSDGISAYAVRNGSVSLKNVTFVNTATSNPVQNYGGYMTLENVTVAQAGDANTAWYSSAVQVINLLVKDENGKYGITAQADTVINSGTYTGKKAVMISAPGGNVTINGGTFNGSEYAIQADFAPHNYTDGANYTSVITINGGTFNGAIKASADAEVVIYGGTFSHDPSAFVAEGYSAVVDANGSYTVVKGDVVASDNASLSEALANGESNIALGAGNFTMPGVSDVTISGTTDTVIKLTTSTANNVTLNGVTVVAGSYQGIQHSDTVVFENCVIKGTQFLYANKVIFKNCTIDLSETADYIWTYSAKNVEFIDCVFNTKGKAILIYNEGPDLVTNVTVKGCTFNATASEDKAAIEIDSHYAVNGHYTLTTENNVFDSEHFTGEWRIKNGATNNTTVNGVTYTWVADGLYKGADNTYYVYDANGLKAINDKMASKSAGREVVINLLNDIDFAGKTWTPVDSHIDWNNTLKEFNGNGYTIYNLTVNGQAMFTRFANNHDVVIKDVTFDNANLKTSSINTAIITGQCYDNLTLDNVDVINSTIEGGYKVGTYVGSLHDDLPNTGSLLLIKDCDVSSTVVASNVYDFGTCGFVGFVYEGQGEVIKFKNSTISDTEIVSKKPNGYALHAFLYMNDADTDDLKNEAEGVTVSGCTFENK